MISLSMRNFTGKKRPTYNECFHGGGLKMNFTIKKEDSVIDLINKRIRFFKEVHERHYDDKTRSICQTKICALEMILNDVLALQTINQNTKL